MPQSYSCDLRERVIGTVEAGASRREAADLFEVSISSAIRWVQRWHEDGSSEPKPRGGSRSVLEDYAERILALVADHGLQLAERTHAEPLRGPARQMVRDENQRVTRPRHPVSAVALAGNNRDPQHDPRLVRHGIAGTNLAVTVLD